MSWNIKVPPLIDFKTCSLTSLEDWLKFKQVPTLATNASSIAAQFNLVLLPNIWPESSLIKGFQQIGCLKVYIVALQTSRKILIWYLMSIFGGEWKNLRCQLDIYLQFPESMRWLYVEQGCPVLPTLFGLWTKCSFIPISTIMHG